MNPMKAVSAQGRWLLVPLCAALPAAAMAHGGELDWHAQPSTALYVLLPLLAAIGLYMAGTLRRVHAQGLTARQAMRTAAFGLGVLLLALGLVWPLDAWAELAFSAHMAQHMVLLLLAPPLLLMGRPVAVWLHGLPPRLRPAFAALRGTFTPPTWRRWAASPSVASVLHGAALWGWHMPWLFDLALRNDAVHWLEHVTLLASGLLFWWAVMHARGRRLGAALLALLVTVIHSGLLGALITLAPRPLYDTYARRGALPDVLGDQQLAGLIMWVPMGTLYLLAGIVLGARALRAFETPEAA